jgi:membrane carboxypeptidase/penicillin-binding protein
MNNGYKDIESVDFEVPKSINLIPIDYDTGKPSTEKGAIIEAFKANYYDKELRSFESKPQVEDLFDPFSKIQDNIILQKEDPSDEIY